MKALTGNRLTDGETVFWSSKGDWVERFAQAEVFGDEAAAEAAEAHAKTLLTVVVDPYLIDLVESEGMWVPLSFRERIRALGPSNHPQHGKQAAHDSEVEALQHAHGAARSTGRVALIKRK